MSPRPSTTDTPTPSQPWTIAQAAGLVGLVGVIAGGLGSFGASSFARGEASKRLEAVEDAVRSHAAAIEKFDSASVRLAVVEANVGSIKESVQRIEQVLRDDRAERRSGGPR